LSSASESGDATPIAMLAWSAWRERGLDAISNTFRRCGVSRKLVGKDPVVDLGMDAEPNERLGGILAGLASVETVRPEPTLRCAGGIHGERMLVGGVRAGGQHGKIADYLLRNQLTDAAVIVELKTPTALLLYDSEYRQDVFIPSRELSGAVQQVLEQRAQFMKQMHALQAELEPTEPRLEIVEPQCVVIVGNTAQLATKSRRRSFEAYRTELRNVRIVTFDEMFAKLTGLAGLLGGNPEASLA
jgi:hypothetical protein